MNKKRLLTILATKEARKKSLGEKANATEDAKELRGILAELEPLTNEIEELRSIISSLPDEEEPLGMEGRGITPEGAEGAVPQGAEGRGATQVPKGQLKALSTYGSSNNEPNTNESREAALIEKYEKRGADLKEKKQVFYGLEEVPLSRSITIDTPGIVIPNQYSSTLNPSFNEISSIVDLVNAIPMTGGETYTKGFEKPMSDEADYGTDGNDYKETDPVNDYVTIAKTFINSYSEISKQTTKLTNINYQAQLGKTVRNSIRKKLARQIMIGDGAAGHFTGIFKAPANVIPLSSDLPIAKIDADTLDKIVFGYGGDEDVEDAAYLVLSKTDLAAFAAVRNPSNGEKLYTIVTKGNTGTISSKDSFSVNYIINSVCPALSAAGTAVDTYCMAYGILKYYEMPLFSDISVEMSTDYKFGKGMIAYAGDVYAGGNVTAYKGFTRIKKAAAV